MADYNLSFKEVTPYQTLVDNWKEINLNTGGTQSTLQDIKVIEKASGYSYKDASKHYTRNRFIYWRISNDILEIVEQSLDLNLTGNKIRYKFVDTPILDGITIHEVGDTVVILVPTVCSVHRLVFPHPKRLHKQDDFLGSHPDLSVSSIFSEASVAQARDPRTFYIFNNPSTANAQLPHCAASHFRNDTEEALFLLAYPSNEIILVRHSATGESDTVELKYESIMPRFLSGIADKFLNKHSDSNVVVSMLLHTIGRETYALTLSRDGNLRVWSCTQAQCIAVNDILLESGNRQRVQAAQSHVLKKTVGSDDNDFLISVYMSFTTECQFHIFRPVVSGNQFRLNHVNILHSPGVDLVDFSLTSTRIWSVWRGEEGDCSVYTADINSGNGAHWVPIILEPLPDVSENIISPDIEPRQAYLQYIFYPGRFPMNIITKALSIYKRSAILSDVNLSPSILKQRISMAVENEIQSELNECEVNDEEYLECANWCWSKFYSCCVQYYMAALRPLGILILPNVSGAVLLKKSMYSILRPLDVLEHLIVCSEYANSNQYIYHPQLTDFDRVDDVLLLAKVLKALDDQLSDMFKVAFERELGQLRAPEKVMAELIKEILDELSEEFISTISETLQDCTNLYNTMHKMLELLRMEKSAESTDYEMSSDLQMSVNHLFSSLVGVSLVSNTLKQHIKLRFSLCRNLLALQHILLTIEKHDSNTLECIRTICLPETVMFIQSYFVLVWFNDLPSLPILPVENMMQRLTPLKLTSAYNLNSSVNQAVPLLNLFIMSSAGYVAHKKMHNMKFDGYTFIHWQHCLLSYIDQIIQLMWPLYVNPLLSEWLLVSGQHLWLQNYVRLMNNWADWSNYTRNLLLGAAFLCTAEYHKSYDLFMKAGNGLHTDEFLAEKLMVDNKEDHNPYMWYFLKIIQLFENHGARSYAIKVADAALNVAKDDDLLVTTIYSIKFKHHLALGHFEKAYDALNSNPDVERKKANLRDFVKTLLEQKQLDLLMSFPYTGLEQLFTSILTTRARATDSINNVYYDFLYSYQVKRGTPFMRLAAGVMYEQAFRLMQYNTMESLEKQVKCHLAAVNALHICDKKFAWVLKPADPDLDEEEIVFPVLAGSEDQEEKIFIRHQIDIIPQSDLKRELEFASARLKLARFDKNTLSARVTTPNELVAILNSCGHYKTALQVCTAFEMPYDVVFESLTQQCVILTRRDDPNAWNWLVENDLHDLSTIANKASTVAWNLLQAYLFEYEEEMKTELHKVICEKLITLKFDLPHWILASYKIRNAAELLRVFLYRGYLEGACNLAQEHILAALGYGVEHFGYKHGVMPNGPAFCLPVHIIDALIFELDLQNQANPKKPFAKEHAALKDLFIKYLETTARISNEVIRNKMSNIKMIS